MSESTRASERPPRSARRRWWRLPEQEWYKLVMAALTLVATAIGAFLAVRQVWPDPKPSTPVKNNYAILLDRSETMSGTLGETSKLGNAAGKILDAVEREDDETTARGLWYFGGGCGQVDESVDLRADNASSVRSALETPPPAHGPRPLIAALDAAVNGLANVPVTHGQGDIQTVRRIVVFTDGPDQCNDDPSRVTTSLGQSAIQVEFHIVGIDLAADERQVLSALAQSLPGVGDEPAELIEAGDDGELEEAVAETVTNTDATTMTTTTTSEPTSTTDTNGTTSTTDTTAATTTTAPTTTRPRRYPGRARGARV
ncbi:MAG TPA: vWA domain-containing protein [Acidimicrobiia bacterium]